MALPGMPTRTEVVGTVQLACEADDEAGLRRLLGIYEEPSVNPRKLAPPLNGKHRGAFPTMVRTRVAPVEPSLQAPDVRISAIMGDTGSERHETHASGSKYCKQGGATTMTVFRTPLHVCVAAPAPKCCAVLLGAGAKTEVKDSNGMTPLAVAFEKQAFEIAEQLLLAGALVARYDQAFLRTGVQVVLHLLKQRSVETHPKFAAAFKAMTKDWRFCQFLMQQADLFEVRCGGRESGDCPPHRLRDGGGAAAVQWKLPPTAAAAPPSAGRQVVRCCRTGAAPARTLALLLPPPR